MKILYISLFFLIGCPQGKHLEKNIITFKKDTIISTSFKADKVIIEDNIKVHFKGKYNTWGDGNPIDSINIGILEINENAR